MKSLSKIFCTFIISVLLFEGTTMAQSNWDSVLDRYELICSQCLDIRQKIASGESVSSKSVTSLFQELSALRTTLSGAPGSMTSSQKTRFENIRSKYASVLGASQTTGENVQKNSSTEKDTSSQKQAVKKASSNPQSGSSKTTDDPVIEERDLILLDRIDSLITSPIITTSIESSLATTLSSRPSAEDEPIDEAFSRIPLSVGALGMIETSSPMAYGVMVFASWSGIGAYVIGSSSFTSYKSAYTCSSTGQISDDGGSFWGTGVSKKSKFSIIAGAMIDLPYGFSPFAGCGYGSTKVYWEDISGDLARVDDLSAKGVLVNAGVMKSFGIMTVSLSATYMPCLNTVTPSAGVGVRF